MLPESIDESSETYPRLVQDSSVAVSPIVAASAVSDSLRLGSLWTYRYQFGRGGCKSDSDDPRYYNRD